MRTILFTIIMVLSLSAFGDEQSRAYYERMQELAGSPQCADHLQSEYNEGMQELLNLAFSFEYCGVIARLRDQDYKRGWKLHTEAGKLVSLVNKAIPCECEIHTHSDNLAYGAYVQVKQYFDTGNPIPEKMLSYCANVP